jgi:hypothetical protein
MGRCPLVAFFANLSALHRLSERGKTYNWALHHDAENSGIAFWPMKRPNIGTDDCMHILGAKRQLILDNYGRRLDGFPLDFSSGAGPWQSGQPGMA